MQLAYGGATCVSFCHIHQVMHVGMRHPTTVACMPTTSGRVVRVERRATARRAPPPPPLLPPAL